MITWDELFVRFVPSHVDGLPDIADVTFFRDRLEFMSAGRTLVFSFASMARWPRPAWLWRRLFHLGVRPRSLLVGERDWFHAPPERFFAFYTIPRIVVYMPAYEITQGYVETYFYRAQAVMRAGGFSTYDLG